MNEKMTLTESLIQLYTIRIDKHTDDPLDNHEEVMKGLRDHLYKLCLDYIKEYEGKEKR